MVSNHEFSRVCWLQVYASLAREGNQPSTPPTNYTTRKLLEKYLEEDTELLSLGSTLGLGADHGHGAAGLAEAEASGGGNSGSREGGRGTQKTHRRL